RRHTTFSRDWSSDVCSSDLTFHRSRRLLCPVVTRLMQAIRLRLRHKTSAACNLGQDVPSAFRLPASDPPICRGAGILSVAVQASLATLVTYETASVAGSILRPGPIVELTDTFLT